MFGNPYKSFFGGFFFMGEGPGEANCKKKYGCVLLTCIKIFISLQNYMHLLNNRFIQIEYNYDYL